MKPLVSVVVPTYNHAGWLGECLDSILAQPVDAMEILVVDDGSTDDTPDVVERRRARSGGRLEYIRQQNQGVAAARNAALRRAQGRYVAFLDADDVWLEGKLQRTLDFLEKRPDAAMAFTDLMEYQGGRLVHESFLKTRKCWPEIAAHPDGLEDPVRMVLGESFILASSVMVRADCVRSVGFFDEDRGLAEDADFWIRVGLRHRIACLPEVLVQRRHSAPDPARHRLSQLPTWFRVIDKVRTEHPEVWGRCRAELAPKLAGLYFDAGYLFREQRDFERARRYFLAGLKCRFELRSAYYLMTAFVKPLVGRAP